MRVSTVAITAEAAISTLRYSSANCGGSAPSFMVQASASYFLDANITFENLAIDGTDGPQDGVHFVNVNLNLRDVLIQNETTDGLFSQSGGDTIQLANSIVADNIGTDCSGEALGVGGDLKPGGVSGGPTPSILPPSQAQGSAAQGFCTSTVTDQREFLVSPGASRSGRRPQPEGRVVVDRTG
jgi:hypothetical protein